MTDRQAIGLMDGYRSAQYSSSFSHFYTIYITNEHVHNAVCKGAF